MLGKYYRQSWKFQRLQVRSSPSQVTWLSTKLIKIIKLMQHITLAALILVADDVSPNPGWTYSALNQTGLKIAQLNVRSLPKRLEYL